MASNTPTTTVAATIEKGGSILGDSFDLNAIQGSFDEWVVGSFNDNKALAQELLQAAGKETKNLFEENSKVLREMLQKEFTLLQKFSFMARMLFNETLGKVVPGLGKSVIGDKVVRATFADEKERLKKEGGAMVASQNNIIYPRSDGFLGSLQRLMRLPSLLGKDENEDQVLRLVTGTTLVVPQKPQKAEEGMLSINLWTQARYYLEAMNPPIRLKLVSPKEAADKRVPAADEIQVVQVEDSIDGNPDFEALLALFDEGNVQWHTPNVAAAVLVKKMNAGVTNEGTKGENVDTVLQGIGVLPFAEDYASLRAQLLGTPAEATPASETETPPAESAPAEATVSGAPPSQ